MDCPFCSSGMQQTTERTEKAIFTWMDNNPNILRNYIFSHASQNVVDDIMLAASLKKSKSFHPSQHCFSRINSLSLSQSKHTELPIRKINSSEFEELAFHPILATGSDGYQSFLASLPLSYVTSPRPCFQDPPTESESNETFSHFNSRFGKEKREEGRQALADSFAELYSSDLMQELVLDIWNDSDLPSLCFKILRNACLLLNADRSSLFMVEVNASTGDRILVSKLFDVTAKCTLAESLKKSEAKSVSLPFGVGIVGWVAQTGKAVNISNVYEDPRFNREVDLETGFHTRCLICMPIKDGAGNVLAVAQAINKQIDEDANSDDKKDDGCDEDASKSVFSARDVSVFRAYTSFCGIGLHQAQILWRSQLETRRSQVLLELARLIFSDQSDVRRLIYTILMHSQSLLTCQRCQFLLVNNLTEDTPDSDVFGEAYDYTWKDGDLDFDEVLKRKHGVEDARFPINKRLACHVARTGETINIPDVNIDSRFDPTVDCKDPVWKSRSILCMPIKHSDGHVLGVCQLVNKSSLSCHCSLPQESLPVSSLEFEDSWSGAFSKNDESLFEAFALFAGLGIANTQMYEQVLRAEAKQRIAFDVLSYHATATPAEASALAKELIPSAKYYRLNQFSFTDLPLSVDDTLKACIRMFSDMGFISRFRIDYNSLCRWLLSVKKNYRAVTYHNWRHAFNVAQTMFVMFKTGGMQAIFSDLECLAIIIACLSHDLDHRGTNNQFQIRTMSPLVNLYSTSVLEHHHFDRCIMLLNTKGNDILCTLSHDEYRRAVSIMEKAILATDLSRYFAKLPEFRQVLDDRISAVGEETTNDIVVKTMWQTETSNRELLMSMLMTASDVSASTKPWPVQKKSAELVANEFFEQGDLEKQKLNIKPEAVMDRDLSHQFPQMQIEFIDTICAPVYKLITRVCGRLKPLLDGCLANRDCWDCLVRGKEIKESLMRLPASDNEDPAYRDRLVALLNPRNTAAAGSRLSPSPALDAALRPADHPTSASGASLSAEKFGDNNPTSEDTTVGGGGAP